MTDTMLSHDGITQSITEWALDYGIYPAVIVERLGRGWTTERALTKPMFVVPRQKLDSKRRPIMPAKPRLAPKPSLPKLVRGTLHHHDGLELSVARWSAQTGIQYETLRKRIRQGMTMSQAIALGRIRLGRPPGVVMNLPAFEGTGGGSLAQDIA